MASNKEKIKETKAKTEKEKRNELYDAFLDKVGEIRSSVDLEKVQDDRLEIKPLEKAKITINKEEIYTLQLAEKMVGEKFTNEEFNYYYKYLDSADRKMISCAKRTPQRFMDLVIERNMAIKTAFLCLYKRKNAKKVEQEESKTVIKEKTRLISKKQPKEQKITSSINDDIMQKETNKDKQKDKFGGLFKRNR